MVILMISRPVYIQTTPLPGDVPTMLVARKGPGANARSSLPARVAWAVPVMENIPAYFLKGTFDYLDLLAISAGAVAAWRVATFRQREIRL